MKVFKLFFVTLILIISTINIFATAQAPDKIFYNGKEYKLHSNPMEEYFKKFPDKKPKSGVISSALWRGYVATFEITENNLFLKDIEIMDLSKTDRKSSQALWTSVLSQVVADDKKLKIDWLTGLLVLPDGEIVNYVHMGYGSTYENYILLEIDKGEFKRAKEFNHKEYEKFKDKQFEAFKKTEEYNKMREEAKKEGNFDQKFFDKFMRSYVTNYTTKILVE